MDKFGEVCVGSEEERLAILDYLVTRGRATRLVINKPQAIEVAATLMHNTNILELETMGFDLFLFHSVDAGCQIVYCSWGSFCCLNYGLQFTTLNLDCREAGEAASFN